VILLLPPSETKRDGGAVASALDLAALSFPELNRERAEAVAALTRLSRNLKAATVALRLGPTQRFEIDRNRAISTSPVLAAIDRYTGVLYDALDAASLTARERAFASEHIVIHSALFGLLHATDPIPAYRLSHDSRLPKLSLRRHWSGAVARTLAEQPGAILDLRSESYVSLGPAPARPDSAYLRVVSESPTGQRKALSHFNKHAKGEFARAVVSAGIVHDSADSLLDWAASEGIALSRGSAGELDLIV
jgi:cytoplasmic iron level regulating protein YaaA (DUF328/UPF0246 family)